MSLIEMCRRLVRLKYELDEMNDKNYADRNKENRRPTYYSICPNAFAKSVIPFISEEYTGQDKIEDIDSSLVIGGTYKQYNESSAAKCGSINDSSFDPAQYVKIGNLPLYIAKEGKNRVRLFQQHQVLIKASTIKVKYPDAKELRLHKSAVTGDYFLSCMNDFFVEKRNRTIMLLYPEVTVPLYVSYGVAEGESIKNPLKFFTDRLKLQKLLESNNLL